MINEMMYVWDAIGDSYSVIMAIVNYVCFGAFILCCVLFYAVVVIGLFDRYYKHVAVSTMIIIIILIIIHWIALDNFGIPILVPPLGTPYFIDFMHIMQYIASVSIVLLLAAIFIFAILGRFDYFYQRQFSGAFIYFVILIVLHFYLEDTFGIKLIFPPNLW